MSTFRAFRVFDDSGKVQGKTVETTLDELSAGDVVIEAAYSSVNYKDALAATGAGKILRAFRSIGGIDVSGMVESSARCALSRQATRSSSPATISASTHDGGYAGYVRVPADWVVPLPPGLTPFDVDGASGRPASPRRCRSCELEHNGLQPAQRPGHRHRRDRRRRQPRGVACLAALGYHVTALTGKDGEHDYLRRSAPATCCRDPTLPTGDAPAREGDLGRRGRPGRRRHAGLADSHDDVRRTIASSGLTGGADSTRR